MAKALIGTLWANTSDLYVRKKRVRSLPNIEAVRLPNQVISDVHAISANNHNYQHLGLIRKLARFLYLLITVIVVIVLPTKVIPPPCTQGYLASRTRRAPFTVIVGTWMQIYKIFENSRIKKDFFYFKSGTNTYKDFYHPYQIFPIV